MMNTEKTLILALALACTAPPALAADTPQEAESAAVAVPQAARVRVKDRASAAAAVAAARAADRPTESADAPAAAANAASAAVEPAGTTAAQAASPVTGKDAVGAPDAAPLAEPMRAAECNPPFKSEIAALFDRWNAALRSGDPKKVVANYAPGSVLLPTVSNRARFTVAEKEEYFAHFLQRRPEGRIDDRVIEVDCNSATDSGLYTFRFGDGTQAKARYTFAYKRVDGEWLIASHHSSGMPEKPEPAAEQKAAKPAARPVEDAKTWVRFP